MTRHARLVALAIACLTGCTRRSEPELDTQALAAAPPSSEAEAEPPVELPPGEPPVDRCVELPVSPLCADCRDSPRNSDGTLKRLPPPPAVTPGETMLLHYDELGPQAMSAGLIGMAWWSWEPGGSFQVGDDFDVRVVVYHGIDEATVAKRFPTVPELSDYRLVERDVVLAYLDEQIADVEEAARDPEFAGLARLAARLADTRALIVRCLGESQAAGP